MPSTVAEYIGFRTIPQGWPLHLPPDPNPGTDSLTLAQDDRVFINVRDYDVKVPESYSASETPEESSYVRVYQLKPDNIWTAGGDWAGRIAYISKRREWLFKQEILGYPYLMNGLLQRKLPIPLDWGGVTGSPPYPNNSLTPVWQYRDNRNAVKFTGLINAGSNSLTSPSSTTGLAIGMTLEGPNIPDGTTISSVGPPITLSKNALATDGDPGGPQATLRRTLFWAYWPLGTSTVTSLEILRYTHWATRILKIEGIGEMLQNPDQGNGFVAISLTGTTQSGSSSLLNVTKNEDSDLDIRSVANGMVIAGPGIPTGTTVVSAAGSTIVMSANATANARVIVGVQGGYSGGAPVDEVYKRLKFHVLFQRVNFELLLATDKAYGGEWSRYVAYQDEPSGRFIQVFGGVLWDTEYTGNPTNVAHWGQPAAANGVGAQGEVRDALAYEEGLPRLIGENTWLWKWIDVPMQAYNWPRILSMLGTVNNATFPPKVTQAPFYNAGQETLLLRSAGRQQKNNSAGVPLWDITFCWQFSGADDGYGYWNRLLNNRGYFQRYYSAFALSVGAAFYSLSDFTTMWVG
jgi:hypothetical protein